MSPKPPPTVANKGTDKPKVKAAGRIPTTAPNTPPAKTPVTAPLAPRATAPPAAEAAATCTALSDLSSAALAPPDLTAPAADSAVQLKTFSPFFLATMTFENVRFCKAMYLA